MAAKRLRPAARRRRRQLRLALGAGAAGIVAVVVFWSVVWPYLVAVAVAGALGVGGWRLWRMDQAAKVQHREWQRQDAIRAGHRSLSDVDKLSGGDFEDLIASLCRRDGCSEVRRVGGSGDNGADVLGRLPDGRSMVIQCKRYAASRAIPARDMRDLAGARGYFKADVAIFVTTSRYTGQAQDFATAEGVIAIHRDHLGLWHKGTPLPDVFALNGAGQGDRAHRARWRNTYGGAPSRRRRRPPRETTFD